MDSEWRAYLLVFILVAVSTVFALSLTEKPDPEPYSISNVKSLNPGIESFSRVSECSAEVGAVQDIGNLSGFKALTFSNSVIGVRYSSSTENKDLYFQKPPTEEECSSGENSSFSRDYISMERFKQENSVDLDLISEGSKICLENSGRVWNIQNRELKLLEFEDQIIGFQKDGEKLLIKRPPTAGECIENSYSSSSEEKDIVRTRALDVYRGEEVEREFYSVPSRCEEWYKYEGIENLECEYSNQGVEDVSLVVDPANFVQSPLTELNYSVSRLYGQLGEAWDIETMPDNQMLITQQTGEVLLYSEGDMKEIKSFDVVNEKMAGLMGAAVDPDFSQNRYIYLYYTYEYAETDQEVRLKQVHSKISRFRLEDGQLVDEKTLLDQIPGHIFHVGGRIEFGPDNKLYATVGDAGSWIEQPYEAQNKSFLEGKILRMNSDGSVPEDNPFEDNYVYSRGHRNPQGLAWNPETEVLYSTEHGSWRHDEVNRVTPGSNYGWGRLKCDEVRKGYVPEIGDAVEPVFCPHNWTLAPSGATFVDDPESQWHGDLFVAGLRGNHLHRFVVSDGEVVHEEVFYVPTDMPGTNRVRDVEYYNGSLIVMGDRDWLARLTPY